MAASHVAVWRLRFENLSSGEFQKIRLPVDCGGSCDPLPTGEQVTYLYLICSLLLNSHLAKLFLCCLSTLKIQMFHKVRRMTLLIETALLKTDAAICCAVLFEALQTEFQQQVRQLFDALPNYPYS